jgi:hypothetical protein
MNFILPPREGLELHGEHQRLRRTPSRYPRKATGWRNLSKIWLLSSNGLSTSDLQDFQDGFDLYDNQHHLPSIRSLSRRSQDHEGLSSSTNGILVLADGFTTETDRDNQANPSSTNPDLMNLSS